MTTTLTLAGKRATSVRVHLPAWGAWYAEVELDLVAALAGRVTLVVNDLTLQGTVIAGGETFGRSAYRIVGGAGQLGKALPAKAYANDAGVKASTVVGDAMREAGETFDATTATARLGPAWTRPSDPAARVLELVAPSAWYVREDGTVRLGARAAATFSQPFAQVEPLDPVRRRVTVAAESIATLLPGVTVAGLEAVDVMHTADASGGLRSTVYGRGAAVYSRFLDSFRRILDQLDPDRAFRGVAEYRVVSQGGNRLDLQPVLSSMGLPDLQRVPVRPGVAGARGTSTPGARVLVAWVNSDPGRPVVVGFEDADGAGFRPPLSRIDGTIVELGATPTDAVALASLVNARLDALRTAYNGHVHLETGGTTAPPGTPVSSLASTASTSVKCT